MGIKQLLIQLDHSDGCKNRLGVAIEFSKMFDARLQGVFVVPNYFIPSYVEAQISVPLMTEITEKAIHRAWDQIRGYQIQAEASGVTMEADLAEGYLSSVLREQSKYADLMILGQDHPDDPENVCHDLADTLLVDGAAPCMVIPHSGNIPIPGKRILLAWNASRESARALREAMPFLMQAETVVVLESEASETGPATDHPEESAISRYLSSHGIKSVSIGVGSFGVSPSEAIIAQCAEMDADLIVMGAYGHTRLREIILGGVTRDLLLRAPVPLLLAH
jgi:nucleotide-binding universal stress UspA family protein